MSHKTQELRQLPYIKVTLQEKEAVQENKNGRTRIILILNSDWTNSNPRTNHIASKDYSP